MCLWTACPGNADLTDSEPHPKHSYSHAPDPPIPHRTSSALLKAASALLHSLKSKEWHKETLTKAPNAWALAFDAWKVAWNIMRALGWQSSRKPVFATTDHESIVSRFTLETRNTDVKINPSTPLWSTACHLANWTWCMIRSRGSAIKALIVISKQVQSTYCGYS